MTKTKESDDLREGLRRLKVYVEQKKAELTGQMGLFGFDFIHLTPRGDVTRRMARSSAAAGVGSRANCCALPARGAVERAGRYDPTLA